MKARLLCMLAAALAGCAQPAPKDAAEVEAQGMRAAQTGAPEALSRLERWAQGGGPLAPLAARELGLALASDPARAGEAVHWLTQAADQGDAEAAFQLGEAHRSGALGFHPDAGVARGWFVRAAEAGHAGASLALARAARNGDAEPRDLARALALLQQASRRGSAAAMYLLSQAHANGEGTPVNHDLARHWLEKAAEQHHPAAMQDLALALEDGRLGVTSDAQAAREQWWEAAEERRNRWR